MKGKISLRVRIFFSMILLTIFSLLLIVVATYFQYFAQNDDYKNRRLIRKETQVKIHLKNIIIKLNLLAPLFLKSLIIHHGKINLKTIQTAIKP